MALPDLKFLVLLGGLPGEGLWSTAASYAALVAQIKDAFGDDYNPIFKYKLPCNPKMISPPNGTCYIVIDDEDDFEVWKNGCDPVPHYRDALDDLHHPPNPLTAKLYVYRKGTPASSAPALRGSGASSNPTPALKGETSPAVLHAEEDVVKMPLYSLLPPLLLLKLGVRVTLRHSNAAEAILLSSRGVSGAGEGHWGLLVRKAQSAWGVQRPSFRYLDLDSGVTAMDVFNARDYMFWSRGVGRERTELVVLEHVHRGDACSRQTADLLIAESERIRAAERARLVNAPVCRTAPNSGGTLGDGREYTVTVAATVRGVDNGLFGPSFTSDALIPPKRSAVDEAVECSLEHHRKLVTTLARSGIF
ncbi:hypothetical protein DQ04_00901080 [Trypanosoma grayi]|uniref:hypothetical protein n=1 Tax=Trypanosoma grayi TaxID=71804 RepID=UPI0004F3F334|nr:hypothetical protein DQ04_00901080 [Trypanosoma grayi]KEG13606.1 hypothetical protein DQ04_00901080 [Trypanosoma grayi]